MTRLCEDSAIAVSELDEMLAAYDEPIYLSGDGIEVSLEGFVKTVPEKVPEEQTLQSAYSVAQLALAKYKEGKRCDDASLVPTYLRLSQAERERLEREK